MKQGLDAWKSRGNVSEKSGIKLSSFCRVILIFCLKSLVRQPPLVLMPFEVVVLIFLVRFPNWFRNFCWFFPVNTYWLIWNQTEVGLTSNQLENGKYNLISVWFEQDFSVERAELTYHEPAVYLVYYICIFIFPSIFRYNLHSDYHFVAIIKVYLYIICIRIIILLRL